MAVRTLDEILDYVANHDGYFLPSDVDSSGRIGVNSHGFLGDTPLHVMAWSGNADDADVLLRAGADPNASGEEGYTPLHVAVARKDVKLIRLLRAAGARVEVKTAEGMSALDLARVLELGPEVRQALIRTNVRA